MRMVARAIVELGGDVNLTGSLPPYANAVCIAAGLAGLAGARRNEPAPRLTPET